MEIYRTITVFSTEMECPNCKRGRMNFTGMMEPGDVPKLVHVCVAC